MPEHLIWLLIAAFMVGLAKGGLTAVASLAVPLLAIFMNPIEAAAFILPIFIATDIFAIWLYRKEYSGRNIAIMVPSVLFGVLLATLIVPYTPESMLLMITGGIGLWYCLKSWFGSGQSAEPREAEVGRGIFWGTITGITTFITHSGAPPMQAYLLPQKLPRLVFAGTMVIIFAIGNLSKLPGYYALGLFHDIQFGLVGTLLVVGIIGTAVGKAIVTRLTDQGYIRVIEVMLLILSVVLFFKAYTLIFSA